MNKITLAWMIFGLAAAPLANFAAAEEDGNNVATSRLEKKEAKKAEKAAKEAQEAAEKAAKEAQKQAEKEAKQARKEAEKAREEAAKVEKEAQKQAEKEAKKAEEEAAKAAKEAAKAEKKLLEQAEKEARKTEKEQPKLTKEEWRFLNGQTQLQNQVSELNQLSQDENVRKDIFSSIWREHGISLKRLQKQIESNPQLGVGDLLVANLISRKIHKPVEEVVATNQSGKTWAQIAQENDISLPELIEQTYKVAIFGKASAVTKEQEI